MNFFIRLLIILLLFTSLNADEARSPAKSIGELRKQLEDVLQEHHVPGMSIAIVHREGPEWISGIGLADVVNELPVTSETRFRIGSTSKAFASLAILKLVEEQRLSLDDSVRKLVPEVWFENQWEESDPVRIVHLLEHTTGWDDFHFRECAKSDPDIGLLEAFEYDHSSRISRWRPGTRMAYCNSGPPVAAYIVEKVTGLRFEEYVEKNFFQSIGMNTATYFQPTSNFTHAYHPDGITPYPYWNISMRPSGAINASALDMANYLLFYLNRGAINGQQVVSQSSIDRMEVPESTWAAREGLREGYGLSNYCSIQEGFVYHGHNGGLDGGLTEMAYLSDFGVGYFYSINASNGEAFLKIGAILRAYLTQNLPKPSLPALGTLPKNASSYSGWYQVDSPRQELFRFLERLLGKTYVFFKEDKLVMRTLGDFNVRYLPVEGMQFRSDPIGKSADPLPSLILLEPNPEGRFIQLPMLTMKQIPAWIAISEIAISSFVLLSITSILLYAPIWLLGALSKRRRRPLERAMRLWPLIAVFSLMGIVGLFIACSSDLIMRLGQLTGWSFTLFLMTLLFAGASIASTISLWRSPKQGVRTGVRVYSIIVTAALMIATTYLTYWGIIGLRTWA